MSRIDAALWRISYAIEATVTAVTVTVLITVVVMAPIALLAGCDTSTWPPAPSEQPTTGPTPGSDR